MPDYVLEPPDLVLVEVLDALPGRPISGERLVRPDGKISLGFYGEVYVAGLTMPEVKEKIVLHLRKYLTDAALGWSRSTRTPTGAAIDTKTEKPKLIEPKDSTAVFVDVTAYNSKNYYVLGDVLITGKMPITGNETVLDAIQFAGGLMPTAAPQNIRLVRPAPPGACCEQVLPVNLSAITSGGDPTTNYQIMPNDRIIVYRDPIVRFTVFLDRLAAPFQTVVSSTLQTSFMIRYLQILQDSRGGRRRSSRAASRAPITNCRSSPVPGSLIVGTAAAVASCRLAGVVLSGRFPSSDRAEPARRHFTHRKPWTLCHAMPLPLADRRAFVAETWWTHTAIYGYLHDRDGMGALIGKRPRSQNGVTRLPPA